MTEVPWVSLTREQKLGGLFAASAYTMWGIAPMYFKQLAFISPAEIIVHRVVWSFLLLSIILLLLKHFGQVQRILRQPGQVAWMLLSALLLMGNWGLFIWAVLNDHMLDASLGYYINPLFNVLLGMFFLGERLRALQWLAVALAFTGVVIQMFTYGSLPWVALILASTFALYGLLRKKLEVEAISGLFVESMLMLPLVLCYWWWFADSSAANMLLNSWQLNTWLMAAGVVSTVPLICFIAGAKRLQLSTMGFFQYIGPSLMFVLGVWVYMEPLAPAKLVTFAFIWLALAVYSVDAVYRSRRSTFVEQIPD